MFGEKLFYVDSEFVESNGEVDLLSFGIVTDSELDHFGSMHFALDDWDEKDLPKWHVDNILPHLKGVERIGRESARNRLLNFFRYHTSEFAKKPVVGYYSAFDFVAFCSLWGHMLDLPKGMPRFFYDLKALTALYAEVDLKSFVDANAAAHDALSDARSVRDMHRGWKRSLAEERPELARLLPSRLYAVTPGSLFPPRSAP